MISNKFRLDSRVGPWITRFFSRYAAFTQPQLNGLPRYRVLLAFPTFLLILGALLVGFSISGTSSGAMRDEIYSGRDPALVAGSPAMIRTDEWFVNTSWSIAQIQQGLPERNETMPGGMDAALPHDLPRADWSVGFRPQLWGYLVFNADHATAFKWWSPALVFLTAASCFLVTLLPRRPILAATLSLGFYLSPFFQWWFLATIFWPMAWALSTLTLMIWASRRASRSALSIWSAVVGYLTVVMAMGIYAPFIVPVVLVVFLFALGHGLEQKRGGLGWPVVLRQQIPLFTAAIVGSVVTAVWVWTERSTLQQFLATNYPGQRLTSTGTGGIETGVRTIGSSFTEALKTGGGFLNINSSESATFFLIGAFLGPVVAWMVCRCARARATLPWALLGLVTSLLLFAAYAYIPGWDALAHLLFLDRSVDSRLRIGLGLASFAILGLVLQYLDSQRVRAGLSISLVSATLFIISQAAIALALYLQGSGGALTHARHWWILTLISAAAIFLFSRRRFTLGSIAFLLVGLVGGATVNPIYTGVFDLRKTAMGQYVMATNRERAGTWVGIGGRATTATLLETGVRALNGTQGAPSPTMWRLIDPTSKYKFNWNRLAGVGWTPAAGEPTITNPAQDQILVTFDACSHFAQSNVQYLLSDIAVASSCLSPRKSFIGTSTIFTVYRVIEPTNISHSTQHEQ